MPCEVGGVPTGAGLVDGGGRPRALIPGEGVREGLAWRGKADPPLELAWWTGGQGGGARARGGCKGFGSGGVGGRGTGPRVSNAWGGGGTHRSWPGGRGGRPRALIPE